MIRLLQMIKNNLWFHPAQKTVAYSHATPTADAIISYNHVVILSKGAVSLQELVDTQSDWSVQQSGKHVLPVRVFLP